MFLILKICMIFIFLCTSPTYAQSKPDDVLKLSKGLDAIERENYTETNVHLKELKNPIAKTILKWAMLRSGHGDWREYQNFLNDNPQWPGLKKLKEYAELKIPENGNPQDILDFFGKQNPQTGFGALKLINALIATNKSNRANKILYYSWGNLSLSLNEQKDFLNYEFVPGDGDITSLI